jgi:Tfp pilus assembly protein PilF
VPSAGPLVELAEKAVASQPDRAEYLGTLGAALYRGGRYNDAVKRLDEAVRHEGLGGSVRTQLFLAMAHHRLVHADKAKDWLQKASLQIEKGPPSSWREKLRRKLLRREAEDLLNHSKP